MSPVQVRSLTLRLLGSGAIGSAAVLEIAGCRFDPYLPSLFCACSSGGQQRTVDNREVAGSNPAGRIEIMGRWCSRLTHLALNQEMVGSNPIRPVEVFRDCGPAEWPQRCQR